MYFSTDDRVTVNFLASVLMLAQEKGQRVRIDVDGQGRLKIKRGEGMWSAPLHGTDDPYRDLSSHRLARVETVTLLTCPEGCADMDHRMRGVHYVNGEAVRAQS